MVKEIVVKEIVLHNHVIMGVEQRRAVSVGDIDLVARIILARLLHGGKEDGITIHLGAQLVIPFLYKEYACLGAGMGFEDVTMQPNHGQSNYRNYPLMTIV